MQILVVKQPSCVIRLISTSTSSSVTLEGYDVGSLALCICQLLEFMLCCGWLGGTDSALLERVAWMALTLLHVCQLCVPVLVKSAWAGSLGVAVTLIARLKGLVNVIGQVWDEIIIVTRLLQASIYLHTGQLQLQFLGIKEHYSPCAQS
jgi:hypothetical protein